MPVLRESNSVAEISASNSSESGVLSMRDWSFNAAWFDGSTDKDSSIVSIAS